VRSTPAFRKPVAAAAALGTAAFAALAAMVKAWGAAPFDAGVRTAVHTLASPPLTSLMRWLSAFGEPPVILALSALVVAGLLLTGRRREALFFALVMAGTLALDLGLKSAFHRPRPEATFFGSPMPRSFSFPSGHSLHATAFFGTLALVAAGHVRRRERRAALWCAAILLALGIGISRVYLGVHYPSDVLAGFASGTAWVAAAALVIERRI
jgi:undecaprenyl-diphosphatase